MNLPETIGVIVGSIAIITAVWYIIDDRFSVLSKMSLIAKDIEEIKKELTTIDKKIIDHISLAPEIRQIRSSIEDINLNLARANIPPQKNRG